jgi:arsenate reductase-like glutaredoxin family protein
VPFESVPEAHCYLVRGELRIDLTHPGTSGVCALAFEEEHPIAPEDIGERKLSIHRAKLAQWATACGRSFDEAWRAREECIAALSLRA